MNASQAASRLVQDIYGTWRVAPWTQSLKWYAGLLRSLPVVARTRTLYAADKLMDGPVTFDLYGRAFTFDVSAINSTEGNGYAFLRELFVRNIYFRAFKPLAFGVCLDIGCNIGIVSTLLWELSGKRGRVVAIDGFTYSGNAFRRRAESETPIEFGRYAVCSENLLRNAEGVAKLAGEFGIDNSQLLTMDQILAKYGLSKIDVLKMDIEGAECELFADPCEWLARVDNVTMETHPEVASPRIVADRLVRHGFDVAWCDPHGRKCAIEKAGYIYASRVGALKDEWRNGAKGGSLQE